VDWWIINYYMQGARNISSINYVTGQIQVDYGESTARDLFKYEDIVSKFQAQIGRLLKIDLSPSVSKKTVGLEDLRRVSTAQMALSSQFPEPVVRTLKQNIIPPLLKYGKMGLATWSNKNGDIGIEVVPPWELLPIPPNPTDTSELGGLARARYVPLDWVKKLEGMPGSQAEVWNQMDKKSVPAGQMTQTNSESFKTYEGSNVLPIEDPRQGSRTRNDQTMVEIVEFVEIWLKNSMGHLKQYIVLAGGKRLKVTDYDDGTRTTMPIWCCDDVPAGGFWSRSFCSLLLPLNIEAENALAQLYDNLANSDAMGLLCTPTSLGVPNEIFRGKDGIRRIVYEPDYTVPEMKPFLLSPNTTGTAPIEGLKVGLSVADKIANQPAELMGGQAPGRVDSSTGLGFLYETSNMPISYTVESIATAMSGCYMAALDIMKVKWSGQRVVSVSMLDDTLAEIQMDADTGLVTLESNQLPNANEVNVGIKSIYPQSIEQQKAELKEALNLRAIDMFEYRVEVRKKNLNMPVGNEAEWQNYRRAVMENISLFGDGQKPGRVITSNNDMHDVHIRVLQAFMARPEFFMASPAVREAFVSHVQFHQEGMGIIPEQAPYPEDAAEEQQMTGGMDLGSLLQQGGMSSGMGAPSGGAPMETPAA